MRYDSSRSSKINDLHAICKAICDFLLVINSNVGPISHRLATKHPWQTTDGQTTTMPIARPLLKYGRLKHDINYALTWSETYRPQDVSPVVRPFSLLCAICSGHNVQKTKRPYLLSLHQLMKQYWYPQPRIRQCGFWTAMNLHLWPLFHRLKARCHWSWLTQSEGFWGTASTMGEVNFCWHFSLRPKFGLKVNFQY